MAEFWHLVTVSICVAGFLITGGLLLMQGETLLLAVLRAVAVFIGLFAVQKLLGAVFVSVVDSEAPTPISSEHPVEEARTQRN